VMEYCDGWGLILRYSISPPRAFRWPARSVTRLLLLTFLSVKDSIPE
jgi:hypothetical protein